MKLRIGSRGSALAVIQSEWVAAELKKKTPGLEISFRKIVTAGDRDQSPSFSSVGIKGVFVKEIEEALLAKEIDLAVHSLKDVPQNLPSGLLLGPAPMRQDARDALISRFGEQLHELPRNSTIGTSSPRRRAQILYKYAKRKYKLEPLRGNIDTRLKKLHDGKYDAIILAVAGLKRLGLESEITQILEFDDIFPAPCQGCLGLELREDDKEILQLLEKIKDDSSNISSRAERAFLQGLGGNCFVPVGVFSQLSDKILKMKAVLLDADGKTAVRAEQSGGGENPELVGYELAERLLYEGGSELMK